MSTGTGQSYPGVVLDRVVVGRVLVPILLLVGWQALTLGLGSQLIPGPVATAGTIYRGFAHGPYLPELLSTLKAVVSGFVIAVVFGGAIGVFLGTRSLAYDLFEPYVLNIYAIPKIILFPLFLYVFKLGLIEKVAFGTFHGFFPMLIITMGAVREVPEIYTDVGRSLRLSDYQIARYIIFPYVLVQLVVALRLAFSLTFLGVILAGLFAAKSGIGLLLQNAMGNFDSAQIIAIVTVLMTIAFVVNLGFYAAQRTLERRWNLTEGRTVQ